MTGNRQSDHQPASRTVKSANRVLDIVELLTRHPRGLGFVEMLTALQIPKSSLHALLRTMTERGHLTFDPHRREYRLGARFWEAGQAFLIGADLQAVAAPFMEEASRLLDETVQLAVLDGLENVYVAKVEGSQRLRLVSEVGGRLPAHATGLGKILLSSLDDVDLKRLLDGVELERLTDKTITDHDLLLQEVSKIRIQGYGFDNGECTPGVFCVAVPVLDHLGKITAAMSSSIPDVRLTPERIDEILSVLLDEAKKISRALGALSDPPPVHATTVERAPVPA